LEIGLFPDAPRTLLFVFPSERREIEARKALHVAGMSVATTVLELAMADPLAPVWLPIGHPIRLPLLDLAGSRSYVGQMDPGVRDRLAVNEGHFYSRPQPPREPP
jgi:hypothetical protein